MPYFSLARCRTRFGAPSAALPIVCAGVLACLAPTAGAQPLPDLFRGALAIDPAFAGAQAQVRAAEQRVVQARAAYGPTVVLTGNQSDTRYREAPNFDLRTFPAKQVTVQLTQPVVRTALYFSHQGAQAQLEQAQALLDQARDDAAQKFVDACFDVLKARDTLAFTQAQRALTDEQLASARRKYRVGSSPITDVREAEAKADTVAAQVAAAEFDLELKQQVLTVLVGHPVPDLLGRGLTGEQLPDLPVPSIVQWLSDALADNPQVRQAQRAFDAAAAEVQRAQQGHAPTIDFVVSYNRSSDGGTVTSTIPRSGESTQAGFNVNIPLFASGATQAKVAETVAQRDKAQNDIDAARRTVSLAVRSGFSSTLSSTTQARALVAAVSSAELALRANRRGYDAGLRVNAEVLDAQTRLFEAQRDLSKARYDAWVSLMKLKVSAGQWHDADLERLDGLLVAVEPVSIQRINRVPPGREPLLPQERVPPPVMPGERVRIVPDPLIPAPAEAASRPAGR